MEKKADNMSAKEGDPPTPEEAAPPGSEDTALPGLDPGDEALPGPGEAPPPSDEEGQRPATEAAPALGAASASERGPASSGNDLLNLIPSDERIVIPEDDEQDEHRIRPRSTLRRGPSMLSQSSRRSSRYHRSMSGIPNLQETLKERQVFLIISIFICVTFIYFLVAFLHNYNFYPCFSFFRQDLEMQGKAEK